MRWPSGQPARTPNFIDLPQLTASPRRPRNGFTRIFAKLTDGSFYKLEPDGTETDLSAAAAGAPFAILQDQKASTTNGGNFASGAWRTRDLNTEVSDASAIVSLASNQFTPISGTYRLRARAPGYSCEFHQTRLQNATAATTTATGSSMYSAAAASAHVDSVIDAIFTANGTDAYEIQHRCSSTHVAGFGLACSFTTEVYTSVVLEKLS